MNQHLLESSLRAWGKAKILQPLIGGHRNEAWLLDLEGVKRVAKTTRRTQAALEWLAPVHDAAERAGFVVPHLIPARGGQLVVSGVTVETFIAGEPATRANLPRIADMVMRFHQESQGIPQRPTFTSATALLDQNRGGDVDLASMPPRLVAACRSAWQALVNQPYSVIHGDLNPSNLLLTPSGTPALVDWDESRVDASLFDELACQPERQRSDEEERALLAWEIAVCWHVEHDYAQGLAAHFM